MDVFFPPEAQADFPVAMQVSPHSCLPQRVVPWCSVPPPFSLAPHPTIYTENTVLQHC